jgi:XRE family aerobic/anaerobic benzoate catabolism transcriptional regulator
MTYSGAAPIHGAAVYEPFTMCRVNLMAPNHKDDLLQRIGSQVRRLRAGRRWTRAQLAERAQLSLRFLAQLESGQGNISVTRLAQVAQALHTSLRQLIPSTTVPALSHRERVSRKTIIALVGLRGAGKSSIGARLAQKLGTPFAELDALVEREASMSLAQVFSMHGESYYRRLEFDALKTILQKTKPMILATGGSIVTDPRTWSIVKHNCTTVWLKASPEVYWNRLLKQGDTRPMKNNPSAMAELRALLAAREPLYAQADYVVDTSGLSLTQAVAAVLRALGEPQVNRR